MMFNLLAFELSAVAVGLRADRRDADWISSAALRKTFRTTAIAI
jgi:hypothetical protein